MRLSPFPSTAQPNEPGPGAPLPNAAPEKVLTPAILVVGAGPAGLSAAIAAAGAGADVLLLDEGNTPAAHPNALRRQDDRLRAKALAAGVQTLRAMVWGAFPGADGPEITALAPGARLVIRPQRLILAAGAHEAPVHLPAWGLQSETGLARLLGARHRVAGGRIETVTDEAGRTSLDAIYAVGDEAVLGSAPVARLRGTLAGLAAARALGLAAPVGPRRAVRRAERFQRALRWAFATAPLDSAALPDDTVVCRCEDVTAGMIRAARPSAGSIAAVKRATRAGMGHCAGRYCGVAMAQLCGATVEADLLAPRPPLRPVLAGAIMADHPDPQDAAVPVPPPTRWIAAGHAALPRDAEVLVIGGGIIGLACALFLAREGVDVVLADRAEPGLAASTANAGSLHVQLVPYVYAAGNGGPMAAALPLGPASIALWREIARDANESLGIRTEGGLILAETAAELDLLRSKAAFERSRGIPSEVIGATDLARMAPHIDGRFVGAAFCASEGQGDPLRGTAALLALARQAGVRVAPGLEITGLAAAAPGWRIETSAGVMRAGQVVNAGGAQARRIGALAGVDVPMHALVQQVIATEAAPPMLRQLVAWTGRHLSLKQGEGGHLLIGGGWPGSVDASGATQVLRRSLEGNLALAARALPRLQGMHVVRAWTGLAPHLDRAPLISATPGAPGLWHAVTGNGYTLGPVVGRMMADAVRGGTALPAAFSL